MSLLTFSLYVGGAIFLCCLSCILAIKMEVVMVMATMDISVVISTLTAVETAAVTAAVIKELTTTSGRHLQIISGKCLPLFITQTISFLLPIIYSVH